MRLYKSILFIAVSLLLSISVLASDVGATSYTEPDYAAYAGFLEMESAAVMVADLDVPIQAFSELKLALLKPDKKEIRFDYMVLKPTDLAKMQNQNFDRIMC